MNYIQPTIVKLSDSDELPSSLRNRYMINLNVVGIQYFLQHFIMTETKSGDVAMAIKQEECLDEDVCFHGWLLEDSITPEEVIDIPRVYISITQDLIDDDSKLKSFSLAGLIDNAIYANGTDDFLPGRDYMINETLYKYLVHEGIIEENDDVVIPNYLTTDGSISEYFVELSCTEKDYSNIEYYYNKNIYAGTRFTEDELADFYSTFANLILKYTQIDDETRSTAKNQVYNLVLNYLANHKSDSTTIALNLILNSSYSSSTTNSGCGCSTTSSCGSSSSTTTSTTSCFDLYLEAMLTYTKTMLSDPDFWTDWASIQITTDTYIMNDTLLDALRSLVTEFMGLGYSVDFSGSSSKTILCGCKNLSSSSSSNDYSVLENFLKMLDYIQDCDMTYNTNKIKVYGAAFGAILPYMSY